jgi:hypothetical protein
MLATVRLARFGFPQWGIIPATWETDYTGFAASYNAGLSFPGLIDGPLDLDFTSIGWSDGITNRARGTLESDGETTIALSITRWGDVRSVNLADVTADQVTIANIPDVLLQARRDEDGIAADILGAKAGWITTTDGDDIVTIGLDSIGGGDRLNTITLRTFDGNDLVTVGASEADFTGTRGYTRDYVEGWSIVDADLGEGDNRFTSAGSRDTVHAGAGNDTVSTGAGKDVARLGKGANSFDGGADCDVVEIAATLAQVQVFDLGGGEFLITGIPGIDLGETVVSDVEWLRLLGNNLGSAGDDVWIALDADACRSVPPSWARIRDLELVVRPWANDDVLVVNEDDVLVFAANVLLGNDIDPRGGGLAATLPPGAGVNFAANGVVAALGGGLYSYTPNADWHGVDQFTYFVTDAAGQVSRQGVVRVTVNSINDAPDGVADRYETTSNAPLIFPFGLGVLANDSDKDNATLAPGEPAQVLFVRAAGSTAALEWDGVAEGFVAKTTAQGGSITLHPDGGFTYTPPENFVGIDRFFYVANDATPGTPAATFPLDSAATEVVIVVNPEAPDGVADTIATTPGAPGVAVITGNDIPNGTRQVFAELVGLPAAGTATLGEDGQTLTVTPPAGFIGTITGQYLPYVIGAEGQRIHGEQTEYTVQVATDPVRTAVEITVNLFPGMPLLLVPELFYTLSDLIPPGTVEDFAIATLGVLSGLADEAGRFFAFTVDPFAAAPGPAATVTSSATIGGSPFDILFRLDFAALADEALAPFGFGTDEHYAVAAGVSTLTVDAAAGFLANDVLPAAATTIQLITNPPHGVLSLVGTLGGFSFTPEAGFTGTDFFQYVALDAAGRPLAAGTAAITVPAPPPPPNRPPVPDADGFTVTFGGSVTFTIAELLDGDTDPDGDEIGVLSISDPSAGTIASGAAPNSFVYTPPATFFGVATATYIVFDVHGAGTEARISFYVQSPPNTDPRTGTDSYATGKGASLVVDAAAGVLANDTDADGDTLHVSDVEQPGNGIVTVNEDGSFTYTPNPGFVGVDTFFYTASDGRGGDSEGRADITVTGGAVVTPIEDRIGAVFLMQHAPFDEASLLGA